jgi:hypothetical protein
MPSLTTRLITDPYFLGGIFLEIDQAYQHADYAPTLEAFIPALESFHTSLFTGQHAPDGTPWAPNAPATVKRKGHGVILFETGEEEASLEGHTGDSIRDVFDRGLTFGTSVEHAIFHNEPGPNSREPQREDVGINDEILDRLVGLVADRTVEQITG